MPMSLKNLLGISLDAVTPDKALTGKLLAGAKRNLSDYSGDLISDAACAEFLVCAIDLLAHVHAWLEAQRPDLL